MEGERRIAYQLQNMADKLEEITRKFSVESEKCQKCGSYGYCYFQNDCGRNK